jgi:hypothetical protein
MPYNHQADLTISDKEVYQAITDHLKTINRGLEELHCKCQGTLNYLNDTSNRSLK